MRVLFESPTLAGVAEHIEEVRSGGAEYQPTLPPIAPADRDGELRLSFAQQRMWILDQLEPENSAYNIPAAVDLEGPLHLASLEQAIDAIVARHEVLRTTFNKSPTGEPELVIGSPRTPTVRFVWSTVRSMNATRPLKIWPGRDCISASTRCPYRIRAASWGYSSSINHTVDRFAMR